MRTILLRDPQQVDTNVYWFALDPGHDDYAATLSTVAATAASVPAGYGTYAVTAGANGYTGLNIVGPVYGLSGLSISASGVCKDIFNYICSKNPNYAPVQWHTNEWGDTFKVWGKFIKAPQRLPTTGEDARLNDAKGIGSKAVIYIGQENGPSGSDGSSYLKRRRVRDFGGDLLVTLADYDVVVLCGELSRFPNEGKQTSASAGAALVFKSGTADARTQILSHPIDRAAIYAGPKFKLGAYTGMGAWTDEGGGMWSCVTGSTFGVAGTGFTMTNAGGTKRALTKVASSAACAALADSVFQDPNYSGSDDRVYVRLADGSNPQETTFFGCSNGAGYALGIADKSYFDFFGIEFYMHPFVGTGSRNATQYAMYACKFAYSAFSPLMSYDGGHVSEAHGQFASSGDVAIPVPIPPVNRWIVGCEFSHAPQAIYDGCGHDLVPLNQKICDNYCHDLSLDPDHGFDLHSSADAHVFAVFGGWDGALIENNSMENVGSQPIVIYNSGIADLADPSISGLDEEDGIVLGLGWPSGLQDNGDGTFAYAGAPARNLKIRYNWIRDINTTAVGAQYGATGMGISFNGDSPMFGRNGYFGGNEVAYNRIEGPISDGSIRTKWAYPDDDTDIIWAHRNVIRGAGSALTLFNTTTFAGVTYDSSILFEYNDVHATSRYAALVNVLNPDHHLIILRNNTYRIGDGTALFQKTHSGSTFTFANWPAQAPSGDVFDAGSRLVDFGVE